MALPITAEELTRDIDKKYSLQFPAPPLSSNNHLDHIAAFMDILLPKLLNSAS